MTHFLSLPRETRDSILSFAISDPKPPIEDKRDRTPHPRQDGVDHYMSSSWSSNNFICSLTQAEFYTPSSTSLLLTNHQLHAEVRDFLHRTSLRYSLDIMLVKGCRLWPTWTSIPAMSTRIDSVTVTLRVATPDSHPEKSFAFVERIDSFDFIARAFYNLLERFLKNGPISPFTEKFSESEDEKRFIIRNLELNIETRKRAYVRVAIKRPEYPLIPRRCYESKSEGDEKTPETITKPFIDVGPFAVFLAKDLNRLLAMCRGYATFGMLLYECIGVIKFTIGGKTIREWDLGKELRDLPRDGPVKKYCTSFQGNFAEWRETTLQLREKAGL